MKNNLVLKFVITSILIYILILLPGVNFLSNYINEKIATSRFIEVQKMITSEERLVLEQIQSISNDKSIIKLVQEEDVEQLSLSLEEKRRIHDLEILSVIDKDGISLSQSSVISSSGNYVLQSTVWGRALNQNQSIASVGVGKDYPLLLAAEQLIRSDGEFAGAIFGGHHLNDKYAANLKEKYFNEDFDVILYSREEGILGSTFFDPDTIATLNSEFSVGSDWVRNGRDNVPVIVDGHSYKVRNVTFADTDGGKTTGGVLVFYPEINFLTSFALAVIFTLILLLVVLLCWKYLLKRRKLIISFVILLMLICLCIIFELWHLFFEAINVEKPSTLIYNSSLSLFPESDIFSLNSSGRVAIKINTGGEAINAVQINLKFDPSIVSVKEIVMENSVCSENLIIEKEIDNNKGEARVSCGLPTPGFQGNNGTLIELIFNPKTDGEFMLEFSSGTKVLANDGLGTDVLRFSENGNFRVIDFSKQELTFSPKQELTSSFSSRPIIFSSSHPNQEKWGQGKEVVFYWSAITANDYIYSIDNDINGKPSPNNVVKNNLLNIPIQSDGVYYFHLAARNKDGIGSVSSYRIKIDNTAPDLPTIRIDKPVIQRGETARFEFSSYDSGSGLQKNFYYSLDNGIFLPVGANLSTSFDSIGKHKITVRSFDNAGNFSDSQIPIDVRGNSFLDGVWWKVKSFVKNFI